MTLSDAQGWIAIIGIVGTTVVTIISAIKSKSNGTKLDVTDKKLDEIHVLTNNNLTSVKADLEIARKDISFLKEFISKNTTATVPTAPEPEFIAKIELAKPEQEVAANISPFPLDTPKTP